MTSQAPAKPTEGQASPKAKARTEELFRLFKTHLTLLLITQQPYQARQRLNKGEINLISPG